MSAQSSGDQGAGCGPGVDSHGLSEALPARPLVRAVFTAGSGRGGRSDQQPQGKGKGTGAEAATDNSQLWRGPCNTHSKQLSVQLRGLGLCWSLSQVSSKASPGPEIGPKHLPCPTAMCGCGAGSAWGLGHLQLSGSSDSWGGKESRSPGSGSPHWCLQGPREWQEEKVRAGIPSPKTAHSTPGLRFSRPPASKRAPSASAT